MSLFKGSGVALITPFKGNQVDYKKLEELINFQINNKTDAIIICGTTGEPATMTIDEKKQVINFTVKTVAGRIPVIAGAGANNTQSAIEMSVWAESIGVDGLLHVTPYYNRTTQKGLYEHFQAINNAVDIPIIVYNVPGRTGLNITPQTVLKLSHLDNVVAIKEASENISQVAKIASLCNDKIDIYSGCDDLVVPIMSLGGIGVISVLANIMPREVHDMCTSFLNGDVNKAREIQLQNNEICNMMFIENNPIPVKTSLKLMGLDTGEMRLPLCDMEEENLEKLKVTLKKYKLI